MTEAVLERIIKEMHLYKILKTLVVLYIFALCSTGWIFLFAQNNVIPFLFITPLLLVFLGLFIGPTILSKWLQIKYLDEVLHKGVVEFTQKQAQFLQLPKPKVAFTDETMPYSMLIGRDHFQFTLVLSQGLLSQFSEKELQAVVLLELLRSKRSGHFLDVRIQGILVGLASMFGIRYKNGMMQPKSRSSLNYIRLAIGFLPIRLISFLLLQPNIEQDTKNLLKNISDLEMTLGESDSIYSAYKKIEKSLARTSPQGYLPFLDQAYLFAPKSESLIFTLEQSLNKK